ncbi:Hypothetical_protein [Hexamita inflata]|uniref:Hypothetical_protein n=1 Tax=Hexamita inflata TaxID=28002 RepID=A0AA86TRL3_9EUKA|nr:Hypothetical protein HINF_LOCUS14189 [Hexamita inflata]
MTSPGIEPEPDQETFGVSKQYPCSHCTTTSYLTTNSDISQQLKFDNYVILEQDWLQQQYKVFMSKSCSRNHRLLLIQLTYLTRNISQMNRIAAVKIQVKRNKLYFLFLTLYIQYLICNIVVQPKYLICNVKQRKKWLSDTEV